MRAIFVTITVMYLACAAVAYAENTARAHTQERQTDARRGCRIPLTIFYPGFTCRTFITISRGCYYPRIIQGYTCGVFSRCTLNRRSNRYNCRY